MKAVTESYCVMFEVKVNPSDMPEIDRRQEWGVSRFLCPGWFSRGQPITAVLRV